MRHIIVKLLKNKDKENHEGNQVIKKHYLQINKVFNRLLVINNVKPVINEVLKEKKKYQFQNRNPNPAKIAHKNKSKI